jgi:hypothetical protein
MATLRSAPHDLPLPGPKNDLKPTPGKTPVPKKGVVGIPDLPPGRKPNMGPKRPSYTAAQEATLHAKQLLAPQYKQADVEAARQNQAIQSYTTAIMQQLAAQAPSMGQPFTQAANAQEGMVNAAAQSLRNVNPSGDVAALLNAVGAPQAQNDQIQGNLNNTFNGGAAVGQYVGSLPIGTLRSQGAAAEALAKLQPGFNALAGRQSLLSALKQQSDARAQIGTQMPKLEQDWLASFQDNKAKQQQLALEAQATGLKVQKQGFDQNLAVTKLKQQQDQFLTKVAQTSAKTKQPSSSLSRSVGYVVDSTGQPILKNGKRQVLPGFNTNAQGRIVKAKKVSASASKASVPFPNLTKTQVQHLRSGIANAFYGRVDPKTGQEHPALGYQAAITEAVKAGYSRAAAMRMANRFYRAGRRGRPSLAAQKAVPNANAQARKGKDATGLGIILP